MLEALRRASSEYASKIQIARETHARVQRERELAEHEVLRNTPVAEPVGRRFVLPWILFGLLTGSGAVTFWARLVSNAPVWGLLLSFTVSTGLLLRAAWRFGRASGARGADG